MNRLRELRLDAGLTIVELADKMGIHPHTIYSWEVDMSHPQHYQIRRLAMLLECDTDMLELIPAGSRKPKKRPERLSSIVTSPLYSRFVELPLDKQRHILAHITPEPYNTAVKRISEGRITTDEAATIKRMMGECEGG